MKQYKRSGQSEIIGLVVIVIIISVIMLFYISSTTNTGKTSTKESIKKQYSHNELATSFVNTLLRTSVCGYDMGDLIADCGTRRKIYCPDGFIQRDSCELVNITISQIINETLDVWKTPYGLTIHYSEFDKEVYGFGDCTRNTTGRAAPAMFPVSFFPYNGEAWVELGICG